MRSQARILDTNNKYSSDAEQTESRTILFLGDSNTSDRESFFNIIRAVFEGSNHRFVDASVSGWRTTEFIDDINFYLLCHEADIVHIMLGTNEVRRINLSNGKSINSDSEYEKNIDFIISVLKARGTKIIMSTLPPYDLEKEAFETAKWTIDKENFDKFNVIIEEKAIQNECVLNDMRTTYQECRLEDILEDDGIHLNKKGQMLLAKKVIEKLIDLMKPNQNVS